METHSGCYVNGSTEHRTLDVDWLINCTSGKTTLQPPWDEDNGFAVSEVWLTWLSDGSADTHTNKILTHAQKKTKKKTKIRIQT